MELNKNLDYDKLEKELQVYWDLFEGDPEILTSDKYLPYYNVEKYQNTEVDKDGNRISSVSGADLRKTREKLSGYTNHAKRFFRRYKSIIFKNDPDITDVEKLIENIDSVDGEDQSFIDFIKDEVFKARYRDGYVFVLTSAYEGDDVPFFKVIPALAVKDWQFRNGELVLFRYEYEHEPLRLSSEVKPEKRTYSDSYSLEENKVILRRYVSKDQKNKDWERLGDDILLDNFTSLPIQYLKGESFIKEFQADTLRYFRLNSSRDNQLYHQGTQKIFVTGNIDHKSVIAMGESTVSVLRSEAGEPVPSVTAIEPTNPVSLERAIGEAEANTIKAAFHLNRITPADSRESEGFQSFEKQKEDLLNVIKTEINQLERFINKILNDYWTHIGSPSGRQAEISLDKDISVVDLDFILRDELAYLEEIKKFPTWYKTHLKRVLERQDYELEDQEAIIEEIESAAAIVNQASTTPINLTE